MCNSKCGTRKNEGGRILCGQFGKWPPISVTLTTSANLFGASLHVSEPFPTFVQGFSPESRETPTNPIYLLHALWYCNAQLPTLSVNYFLVETEALVHITFPLGAFVVEPSLHCISINKLPWSHKKEKTLLEELEDNGGLIGSHWRNPTNQNTSPTGRCVFVCSP